MKRYAAVLLVLLVAWACFGLVAVSLADREAGRSHDLGELARECSNPGLFFLAALSVLFVCDTVAMAWLAPHFPSGPDKIRRFAFIAR